MTTLREGGRNMTASRSRLTAGRLFVGTQVALSLLLLLGAGLFLRTLINLQNVDLGYKKESLAMLNIDASAAGYQSDARGPLFLRVLDKLRSTPGITHATFSSNGLFSGNEMMDEILVEGYTATGKDDRSSRFDSAGPGYFSELGIPLLQGREFDLRDAPHATPVCVVNEAFARQFFPGRNPIGKHVTALMADKKFVIEVVGVARNSRDHALRTKVDPRVFIPFLQGSADGEISRWAYFEVRLASGSGAGLTQIKNAVAEVDRNLEVDARFLTRSVDDQLAQERLVADLVTLFGVLALALAAIGIYGILAYGVSQRTNEIGLRMAIGAGTGDVVRMIARETLWMISSGLAVGLAAAYFLTNLIKSKLFGITTTDPVVVLSAVAILALVGFLAATLPALRASRIDPAIALRDE
jgi:predicted permease